MSYCRIFGKDKVCFVTKEDHAVPSTVKLPPPEPLQSSDTNTSEINWGCSCLGDMPIGPCGIEFRELFSCYYYSEADPPGSDCYEAFRAMQVCSEKYPDLYKKDKNNNDNDFHLR